MAKAVSALLVFLLLLTLNDVCSINGQSGGTLGTDKNGTTPEIETIFKNRCNTFQKQNPVPFVNNPKNCTLLWELFLGSFARKGSCSITASDYKEFLREANHTAAIKDKAMFWAFVSPFVYNFTASQSGQYLTILNLLPGYILNNLEWCWNSSKNDLDYDSCPFYKNCPFGNEAVKSFWIANSEMFASVAAGKVFAMLNGSTDDGAYTNRSIFYTVEVPAMRNTSIKEMQVILVHNPGGPFRESCDNGTLVELKNHLSSKSITVECVADPPAVTALQCHLYPQYANYCPKSGTPTSTVPSIVVYQFITIIILWVNKFS